MEGYKTSIKLPYSYENLKTLLNAVCKQENPFPQIDFYMWCDNLTTEWMDEDLNDQDQLAYHIAMEIEAQWDLHWYEFYSHKELMKIDLSKLELPPEWFEEWAVELNGNNQ